MSSKISDVGRDLQVTENDMREIRVAKGRSRLLTLILGAVVLVVSFVAGYIIGADSTASPQNYPYSAAAAGPLMAAGRGKRKWLLVVVLAVLAFFSFVIGEAIGNPGGPSSPSLGVVTYYGAHSRET
jgi:hypothetical protein